jgi:hypothetical protein
MNEQEKGTVLMVVATMPFMMYRLFRSYLRVKASAKIASKEFYRSLLANGLPKREAKALRDEYGSGLSITSLIRDRRSR